MPADRLQRPVVVVIPCGAEKLDATAPARDLYVGSMFRMALAAAEAEIAGTSGRILILSALHGLLELDTIVAEHTGWQYTLLAIAAGTILSAAVDWHLAVASGCAFLISETCDLGVYTPLRERGWVRAVALSGLVGAIIDSTLFLWLAEAAIPGPTFTLKAVAGLTLAKLAVVAATTAAAARYRRQLAPTLA